eukprot:gnl/Chilomastix_caulleri/5514.p1 GENE.gnl/Chilomastix_caulleri/5514~~gnl/Chilomastix_caulleri/5514.p1  ORF type:complete len:145 (-),score=15.78 gnl/Chilomastix_caulleri/5514:58-492(-)
MNTEVDAVISISHYNHKTIDIGNSTNDKQIKKICIIVTRCSSHLPENIQALIPFKVKSLPPIALLFGAFEESGYYPEVEYIEINKEVDISTEEKRHVLKDDIIKRVNGVEWSNEQEETLMQNINQKSLECPHNILHSKMGDVDH